MFARRPLKMIFGLGMAQYLAILSNGIERVGIDPIAALAASDVKPGLIALKAKRDESLPRCSRSKYFFMFPRRGKDSKSESLPIHVQQPIVQSLLHDVRFALSFSLA